MVKPTLMRHQKWSLSFHRNLVEAGEIVPGLLQPSCRRPPGHQLLLSLEEPPASLHGDALLRLQTEEGCLDHLQAQRGQEVRGLQQVLWKWFSDIFSQSLLRVTQLNR